MESSNIKKSRRNMILIIVAFVLPIILAKFALQDQWFNYGVTNKGSLIDNELTLTKLGVDNSQLDKQWLMLYRLPQSCQKACQQALVSINNTYIALGKEMPRVTPVGLTNNQLPETVLNQIRSQHWQFKTLPNQAKEQLESSQLLIVDPLGNVVLAHDIPAQVQQLPQFGKNILADMKKLLKYSRIG